MINKERCRRIKTVGRKTLTKNDGISDGRNGDGQQAQNGQVDGGGGGHCIRRPQRRT